MIVKCIECKKDNELAIFNTIENSVEKKDLIIIDLICCNCNINNKIFVPICMLTDYIK